MRKYLTEQNLIKAAATGVTATLFSLPRLILAKVNLALFVPTSIVALTLVAGAATAWSANAGMCGIFPSRRRMFLGACIGLALAGVSAPLFALRIDPLYRQAIAATGNAISYVKVELAVIVQSA